MTEEPRVPTSVGEDEIDRLRKLLAKATPVPWKAVPSIEWDFFSIYPDTGKREFPIAAEPLLDGKSYIDATWLQNNFALIVGAVNALPTLLDRLSSTPAFDERERLREALQAAIMTIERERDKDLDAYLCCGGGADCGCRGSTKRDLLVHDLRSTLASIRSGDAG